MNTQSTSHILMIRPVNFGFNEETAGSNAFQNRNAAKDGVNEKAQQEFDRMVNALCNNGVDVTVIDDTREPYTPDSIFPNNWVSFHDNGEIFLYPMQAENRRLERREDIIAKLEDNFAVKHIIDLSRFEAEDKFLEGTGSMVLDRENKIAYACLSPRTNRDVLNLFCEQAGYTAISFDAVDEKGKAIYHTNVLMCVGSSFAVICLDSIPNPHERIVVKESLLSTQKEIIEISFEQMNQLNDDQKTTLEKYGKLIYSDINTIETNGGGSARCMMAEVHLPQGS
jgi:hypothetical protein